MDAVITAGGIPQPEDPLYLYSKGEAKALIDIAGKPMIQWVLDAVGEARTIDRAVVIGLTEKARLTCKKPLYYLSNEGKLLENLKAGTARVRELNPKAKFVLFVSADIPGITGAMVDWVVKTCAQTNDDLYYNVIRREAMEGRFPTSKRTYTRLKGLELCGGDMNMARISIVNENSEFWTKVLEARKNPPAQAALIGGDIILKFLVGQLTIDAVIQRVADKLGIKGRAIICPYPEVGMDVDKPHQLEIMRAYLGRRPGGASAPGRSAAKRPAKRPAKRRPARPVKRRATKAASRPARKIRPARKARAKRK